MGSSMRESSNKSDMRELADQGAHRGRARFTPSEAPLPHYFCHPSTVQPDIGFFSMFDWAVAAASSAPDWRHGSLH